MQHRSWFYQLRINTARYVTAYRAAGTRCVSMPTNDELATLTQAEVPYTEDLLCGCRLQCLPEE
jgi:hypothetical protein